jgi:hypothetical protein
MLRLKPRRASCLHEPWGTPYGVSKEGGVVFMRTKFHILFIRTFCMGRADCRADERWRTRHSLDARHEAITDDFARRPPLLPQFFDVPVSQNWAGT